MWQQSTSNIAIAGHRSSDDVLQLQVSQKASERPNAAARAPASQAQSKRAKTAVVNATKVYVIASMIDRVVGRSVSQVVEGMDSLLDD
jgi:hypothetical protein